MLFIYLNVHNINIAFCAEAAQIYSKKVSNEICWERPGHCYYVKRVKTKIVLRTILFRRSQWNWKLDCYSDRSGWRFTVSTSHKFWKQSLYPRPLLLSMLFASVWESFLAQASLLLLFQYVATLSRRKGSDLFLQSGPSQNFFPGIDLVSINYVR